MRLAGGRQVAKRAFQGLKFWRRSGIILRRTGMRYFSVLAAALLAGVARMPAEENSTPAQKQIEICFVLDATGSMGGLIEGAKQKIWSIANEVASAKPAPSVKFGLIASGGLVIG